MGDRTYTTITFQTEYLPLFSAAYEKKFGEAPYATIEEGGPLTELIAEEANYGDMPDEEFILGEYKIPYDKTWENGGDYLAGTAHIRFDSEGVIQSNGYEEARYGTVGIQRALLWIKEGKSLEELKSQLETLMKDYQPYENQLLENIPVRDFTPEEAAMIMEHKMGVEVDPPHG